MPAYITPPHTPEDVVTAIRALSSAACTELLHTLREQARAMTSAELAEAIGATKVQTRRHLTEMEAGGLVEADVPPEQREGFTIRWSVKPDGVEKVLQRWREYVLGAAPEK